MLLVRSSCCIQNGKGIIASNWEKKPKQQNQLPMDPNTSTDIIVDWGTGIFSILDFSLVQGHMISNGDAKGRHMWKMKQLTKVRQSSFFQLPLCHQLWGLNIVILWAKWARTWYMKNGEFIVWASETGFSFVGTEGGKGGNKLWRKQRPMGSDEAQNDEDKKLGCDDESLSKYANSKGTNRTTTSVEYFNLFLHYNLAATVNCELQKLWIFLFIC